MEAQHRCAALVGRHAHISRFQSERIKRWKSNRWLPRPHRQTAKLLTWILAKSKWCLWFFFWVWLKTIDTQNEMLWHHGTVFLALPLFLGPDKLNYWPVAMPRFRDVEVCVLVECRCRPTGPKICQLSSPLELYHSQFSKTDFRPCLKYKDSHHY